MRRSIKSGQSGVRKFRYARGVPSKSLILTIRKGIESLGIAKSLIICKLVQNLASDDRGRQD